MKMAGCFVLAGLCGLGLGMMAVRGAENGGPALPPQDDGALPQPVRQEVFEALLTNPPFTRSLGVSDSLILTGVAWSNHEVYATLLDTKTQGSQIVSRTPNTEGWRLVEVGGDRAKLQTWTARIQIPGGEIIAIRYQPPPPKLARSSSGRGSNSGAGGNGSGGGSSDHPSLSSAQLDEAKNAAVNYREGFNADGYPRQPPPEMVAKLSRLNVDQRAEINRQMFETRNRGLGMEERRQIYEGLVNRAGMGRR